ncbi:MAG: glycoside hydrolase/phage tail family protein [Pelagimonas sp.]
MATVLLSAAGAALGSSIGGSVLGLSMTAVGRFAGASLGRRIDQAVLGQGSEPVETGRVDRFRLTGAGEGATIPTVFGRVRIGGHVIWASQFSEHVTRRRVSGGGKGAPSTKVDEHSYSVSLALALCEGEITGVTRVWADGVEQDLLDLNMRVYPGTGDQLPDPAIEAIEGAGTVPAYRGTAYVVFEDLPLGRFGNRVPQFSFEVTRPDLSQENALPLAVRGVAMVPGTGEYALASDLVYRNHSGGPAALVVDGGNAAPNNNTPNAQSDLKTSLDQMEVELPNCGAVSLIVSWFGDDLRCGSCQIRPKVEQVSHDAETMPWEIAGLSRSESDSVPTDGGNPVYGGTPCDQSVVQAIMALKERGQGVMYYPFILMDQMAGNTLPDPWSAVSTQAHLPWRGRITLSAAPRQSGTPDQTEAARDEVAAFFGSASASDFALSGTEVQYTGPEDWGYRHFVLHQAALCAAAGGVEAFCIGSEMRGLTQIRDDQGFVAVEQLRLLASECRALLGASVKIGYAADWSEYFGYHPQDGSGDVYFHLDPLWADPNIDFIGIDNYMPLSDWREGESHADAHWGAIHNPDYLRANVEGGEGYDWYYSSETDRENQLRTPVTDGAFHEPWVWRYKDLRNWWGNTHYNRIDGIRDSQPTDWVPQSKPIWFTEVGCAAIDKGANQPNKFLDPKSSESALPWYSTGRRDDAMMRAYLEATLGYWAENNPISVSYGEPMLDLERSFVWAWDARPYPWFPATTEMWSDGPNYQTGHWLNGRASGQALGTVVRQICATAGLTAIDVSELYGEVRGYVVPDVGDARRALQPLMLAYGFDAIERDGVLVFRMRAGKDAIMLDPQSCVVSLELDADLIETRAGDGSMIGHVRLGFVEADGDHILASEEAHWPGHDRLSVSESEIALTLTRSEAKSISERWLAESRAARETLRFALPPSRGALGAGDVVRLTLPQGDVLARIDQVEVQDHLVVEAVRVDPNLYHPSDSPMIAASVQKPSPATPVTPVLLDLPLLTGDEVPHAPYIAAAADPWPGEIALYDSEQDAAYALNTTVEAPSILGVTESELRWAPSGVIDRGAPLKLRLSGASQSISDTALWSGENVLAIGDGTGGDWEVLQFRDAELQPDGSWQVSHRLRGQAGTDALMPEVWPSGSVVVRLDGAPKQIALSEAQRFTERHFRIGAAHLGYDHPSYVHQSALFAGVGLRPYAPVHLHAQRVSGDLQVTWIRRTRVGGDHWHGLDVPLAEAQERYLVRIEHSGTLLHEDSLTGAQWTYPLAQQIADGVGVGAEIAVAQISDRFGPGLFTRIAVPA